MVINELVQNAVQHGFREKGKGKLSIKVERLDGKVSVIIQDDGPGLPKSLDPVRDGNLGLTIVRTLVKDGLPKSIQKAMDSLRIIGNEAVHPGTLDLRDDESTVLKLFKLVNVVVENRISQVREIEELYDSKVPAPKRDAVEKRDTNDNHSP